MMVSMRYVAVLVYVFVASGYVFSSYSNSYVPESICRGDSYTFLHDLRSQCPVSIPFSFSSPVEMNGESLDEALLSSQKDDVTAILFYASWCPFSTDVKSKFSALSSMFPQIRHVMVEQSEAMPSVFSRYGIHSLPSILIVNQTTRVRYHGQKDLYSIANFYKRTTGYNVPLMLIKLFGSAVDMTENQTSYAADGHSLFHLQKGSSLKDRFSSEPYLLLSAMFVFLRAFLYFFPGLASHVVALWVAHIPHLNMGIFGESRQLLGRVLNMIDLNSIWSKVKLCKMRNFHKGARKARVWASSLTSVSLGEASSSRVLSPSGDL